MRAAARRYIAYRDGKAGWRNDRMLPRKWSKIGHGLMLAGVIGIILELLFWIPNMEVGWKDIVAVVWMVVNIVLAFGGLSLLKWKCRCPHCGARIV